MSYLTLIFPVIAAVFGVIIIWREFRKIHADSTTNPDSPTSMDNDDLVPRPKVTSRKHSGFRLPKAKRVAHAGGHPQDI